MIFRRRHAGSAEEPVTAGEPAQTPVPDEVGNVHADAAAADTELLVQTVARHFDDAQIVGPVVHIESLGLSITCQVASLSETGSGVAAAIYFDLAGAAFGAHPVFATISGYGSSPPEAIVEGACLWCCSFGPALRSALTGADEPEAHILEAVIDGRPYRLHVGNLDRLLRLGDGPEADAAETLRRTREHLGGDPLLTPVVLRGAGLPVLAPDAISVLSVFVMEQPDRRTVEIKIGGRDWTPAADAIQGPHDPDLPGMAMLRELAVLVPTGPAVALTRNRIERTLHGFDPTTAQPMQAHGWPGWLAHGGRLDAPLSQDAIVEVEARTGPLPADYRRFLTEVAGGGAGPGYGLLTPSLHDQVLLLAHAGCGVAWVMRLDEDHRGQVWVDAAGSDGTYQRVAASFDEWYTAWIDAAVRSGPWLQWDPLSCSTAAVLVQWLESDEAAGAELSRQIGSGGIVLSGGGRYLPAGATLDPCHGCVEMVARFGLGADVFAAGDLAPEQESPPSN